MRAQLLLLALLVAAVSALGPRHLHNGTHSSGICGTDEYHAILGTKSHFADERVPSSACVEYDVCDDIDKRLAAGYGNMFSPQIKIKYVVARVNGSPVVSVATIQAAANGLNADFAATGIVWDNNNNVNDDIIYIDESSCLPGYSSSGAWAQAVSAFKIKAGQSNVNYANVYIHCMTQGTSGTLLGVATFPWMNWQSTSGGLFLNSVAVGAGQRTFAHEIGHNLGLWHSFHGVSEMSFGCSSTCSESQSVYGTSRGNEVGDMCSDTIAAPLSYTCGNPSGSDCNGQSWSSASLPVPSYRNIMSYSPDNCMNTFTAQQGSRARCYLCEVLTTQLYNPEVCP